MANTKQFFKEDVTVLSFNSITGMMDDLGRGTATIEAETVENRALLDDWKDGIATVKGLVYEGELAATDETGTWLGQVGTTAAFVYTSTNETVSCNCVCTRAEKVDEDAQRYNVRLESRGEVTIT